MVARVGCALEKTGADAVDVFGLTVIKDMFLSLFGTRLAAIVQMVKGEQFGATRGELGGPLPGWPRLRRCGEGDDPLGRSVSVGR